MNDARQRSSARHHHHPSARSVGTTRAAKVAEESERGQLERWAEIMEAQP